MCALAASCFAVLLVDSACVQYVLLGTTFTESGTYILRTPNTAGCDSVITLKLTIPVLEPIINVEGLVLGVVEAYSSYQWFLNGTLIPGATDREYIVTENGDYTVKVTNVMGCEGLSAVYKVTNVPLGIRESNLWATHIRIYPNPASIQLNISNASGAILQQVDVINVLGQVVHSQPLRSARMEQLDVRQWAPGYYILRMQTDRGVVVRPFEVL